MVTGSQKPPNRPSSWRRRRAAAVDVGAAMGVSSMAERTAEDAAAEAPAKSQYNVRHVKIGGHHTRSKIGSRDACLRARVDIGGGAIAGPSYGKGRGGHDRVHDHGAGLSSDGASEECDDGSGTHLERLSDSGLDVERVLDYGCGCKDEGARLGG